MNHPIDFVIPWVDGSDPAWQAKFARVSPTEDMDARASRYRDWDLLRYWFRGVEQFAPWVNKIHFITWGHVPPWLNVDHPKLHIVNHKDYIPKQYLPTFSSHPIELNLHRIDGLAEHFVYFNDDMFLLSPRQPHHFFRKNLPCDSALMNPISTTDLQKEADGHIFYPPLNNTQYLNLQYDKRTCIRKHLWKWYHFSYGNCMMRNLLLSPWPRFVGFVDLHLPQAYLKNTFEKAWLDAEDILDQTCAHPIRNDHDVNQWFMRYRQLAEGNFSPQKPILNASFHMVSGNPHIIDTIKHQRKPMICIHDGNGIAKENVAVEKLRLQQAFETLLPRKSRFEQ